MIRQFRKFLVGIGKNAVNHVKINELLLKANDDSKNVKINVAQLQHFFNLQKDVKGLSEVEFQVFSQGGEDGIIQYLISKIEIPHKTFIEFGVENYKESNTRFLFINNHWSGQVIDGSKENVRFIEHDLGSYGELYTTHAFVTRENINDLLKLPSFHPEVGLLSVDIDGNDYWVWEAITVVNPVIVVAEYNGVFGANTYWSIPYDTHYVRRRDHAHQLYYGASLQALIFLAQKKGYTFVGCNKKGNNCFFIRNDKMTDVLKRIAQKEKYVISKFREARNSNGWITGTDRIKAIAGLPVVDVRTGETTIISPELVEYS